MKKTRTLFGIIAACAMIGFTMTACDDGTTPGGDGGGTTPAKTYRVTFDLDGGTGDFSVQEVKDGEVVNEPVDMPSKGEVGANEEYFLGWYKGGSQYNFADSVKEDITLRAMWAEEKTWRVYFNTNGGVPSYIMSQFVEDGSVVGKPDDPTKSGNTFEGWFIGDTEFDFDTDVDTHITLVAKWKLVEYDVTFDPAGGKWSDDSEEPLVNKTIDQKAIKLTDTDEPTKEDFWLEYWMKDGAEFDFDTTLTGNITLTAKWTEEFTVTFDANGGAWDDDSTTMDLKTEKHMVKNLPTTAPTNTGAGEFEGWVNVDDTDFDFASTLTDNITLKAKYAEARR